jgi:hypothetical protein
VNAGGFKASNRIFFRTGLLPSESIKLLKVFFCDDCMLLGYKFCVGILQGSKDSLVQRLALMGTMRRQGEADNVMIKCKNHNMGVKVCIEAVKNQKSPFVGVVWTDIGLKDKMVLLPLRSGCIGVTDVWGCK